MKTNLLLLVLIGLVVYVMVKTNQQLAATSAALQTNKPLVATEQVSLTPTGSIGVNPDASTSPVNYLAAYVNA